MPDCNTSQAMIYKTIKLLLTFPSFSVICPVLAQHLSWCLYILPWHPAGPLKLNAKHSSMSIKLVLLYFSKFPKIVLTIHWFLPLAFPMFW